MGTIRLGRHSSSRGVICRNPFLKPAPGAAQQSVDSTIDTLRGRGAVFLLCDVAAHNWSSRMAETLGRKPAEVYADVKANLVPGTLLMPSGIFALIRAQNAGCAFMRGS